MSQKTENLLIERFSKKTENLIEKFSKRVSKMKNAELLKETLESYYWCGEIEEVDELFLLQRQESVCLEAELKKRLENWLKEDTIEESRKKKIIPEEILEEKRESLILIEDINSDPMITINHIPYKNQWNHWVWKEVGTQDDMNWPGLKPPMLNLVPKVIGDKWYWVNEGRK